MYNIKDLENVYTKHTPRTPIQKDYRNRYFIKTDQIHEITYYLCHECCIFAYELVDSPKLYNLVFSCHPVYITGENIKELYDKACTGVRVCEERCGYIMGNWFFRMDRVFYAYEIIQSFMSINKAGSKTGGE